MDRQHANRPQPHVRLATADGKAVAAEHVPITDIPETTMFVSFEGLTDDEARAALAGFPGGKRFVLVPSPLRVRRAAR